MLFIYTVKYRKRLLVATQLEGRDRREDSSWWIVSVARSAWWLCLASSLYLCRLLIINRNRRSAHAPLDRKCQLSRYYIRRKL